MTIFYKQIGGGEKKSAFYAPILRFFGKKQICCVQGREFSPFSLLYNSQKNKKTTKKILKLAIDNYIIFSRGVYSRGRYIPHAFHRRGAFISKIL